ncbi:hypothetical protein HED63_25730 [Ochrobactrum cytisi]|nr:hypothetical protein [Brucella cytisi]
MISTAIDAETGCHSMNFLHNFGSAILLSQFASRQLQGLHTLIDRKRIPVEKSDDFYRQTLALDRITGEGRFGRCYHRYSLIRKVTVAVASIIIVPALAVFLLSKVPSFGSQINELMARSCQISCGSFTLWARQADFCFWCWLQGISIRAPF